MFVLVLVLFGIRFIFKDLIVILRRVKFFICFEKFMVRRLFRISVLKFSFFEFLLVGIGVEEDLLFFVV